MFGDQNSQLTDAAGTPSVAYKPNPATMTDATNTALGHGRHTGTSVPQAPQAPASTLRTQGSFEGYFHSAPARLQVNKTGYENPNYHSAKYRPKELINHKPMASLTDFNKKQPIKSVTSKAIGSNVKGSSATRLGSRMLMNKVF